MCIVVRLELLIFLSVVKVNQVLRRPIQDRVLQILIHRPKMLPGSSMGKTKPTDSLESNRFFDRKLDEKNMKNEEEQRRIGTET